MTTEPQSRPGMEQMVDRRKSARQRSANASGMTLLKLDSTWWGNKVFGDWSAEWWVTIDASTDKAYHVSEVGGSGRHSRPRSVDEWVPISVTTIMARPEWSVTEPEGDVVGELKVGRSVSSRYGMKATITGDTYQAFKEDNLKGKLMWEKCHPSWNGDAWTIDADEASVAHFTKVASRAGYTVKTLP